jgi:hypothetical protein
MAKQQSDKSAGEMPQNICGFTTFGLWKYRTLPIYCVAWCGFPAFYEISGGLA